jgi:hypothetical protein
VSVKADKLFRIEIGQTINIAITHEQCQLFDAKTGWRMKPDLE